LKGNILLRYTESLLQKKASLEYSQSKEILNNEILSKFSNIKLSKEKIVQTYGYDLNGFTAKLNDGQLETLKKDIRIKRIEQDQLITLAKPLWAGGGGGEATPPQEIPWGITRVNGGISY
jgi:hypothetical protein